MKERIIGIDIARALAVIGMIIVNFKVVLGENGLSWVKSFASAFEGKAAATFVVLAGVGLALMTNSALRNNDSQKLKTAKIKISKRASFLFIVGLSYIVIWPADWQKLLEQTQCHHYHYICLMELQFPYQSYQLAL